MWVQPLVWEDPLEEKMAIHSVFLPGESHGQSSLVQSRLQSMGSQRVGNIERLSTHAREQA